MASRVVLDTECYRDYWLVMFRNIETGATREFELHEDSPLDTDAVMRIMRGRTTVGFNSNSYDLPMIFMACLGHSNEFLKDLSDKIILGNMKPWEIERHYNVKFPRVDHIDLIEVAPGQASLKIYGGRLHARRMQDLPIEPNALIAPDQRGPLRVYCGNDLDTTIELHNKLVPQLELREQMSREYKQDLRSKSDAQIAEAVIKSQLEQMTGNRPERPIVPGGTKFRYKIPHFIEFQSGVMQRILDVIRTTDFVVSATGSVEMPPFLAEATIPIGRSLYRMGIGGLHSSEESVAHFSDEKVMLVDRDVTSYYPMIIIGQQLFPKHLGSHFLDVYKGIVRRRVDAKRRGDKVTDSSLKITINGSFGKFGSKWSALYSPELLIQTTLTGQLALLMLIEALEEIGIPVVSANTDGVVIKCPRSREKDMLNAISWWEAKTSFNTEETRYAALYSRDVNNYLAVKEGGDVKRKGAYAEAGLQKNPANEICVDAIVELLTKGTSLWKTVKGCRDIRKFVTVRTVKGGAYETTHGEYLGKAVRFYYSTSSTGAIHYKSNDNLVPRSEGALALMEIPEEFPDDVNYHWYIDECYSILRDIGYYPKQPKVYSLRGNARKEVEALI